MCFDVYWFFLGPTNTGSIHFSLWLTGVLSRMPQVYVFKSEKNSPPAQNQYMQEKILGELIFVRIHAGPVFALARIQENIFEESLPEYFAKFLGEFARCEYMPRLYSHPREYRKIFLANYLCIGFVPGGKGQQLKGKIVS